MHIKYLVQYTGDRTILPDGIAYHGKNIITEEPLSTFTYKLLNQINTSIMVTSERNLYVLVKLVDSSQVVNTKIGVNDFHYTSEKDNFYFSDYILIKIGEEAFKKFPCTNCQLLISIYSKDTVGQIAEYNIEVSQNFMMLEEG